jgi:rSAM/selenodomain-associated transferase 2
MCQTAPVPSENVYPRRTGCNAEGAAPAIALSVVVPALDEAPVLGATLSAARQPGVAELIVVDGGSRDATVAIARRLADRVLAASRGRALQMNAGAAAARGDVLLFLHADSRPPAGYAALVAAALADPAVVGGRFDLRLDAPGVAYRVIERLISLRSRLTRVATGDQALFVRRAVFERLGGFPPWPLMEDLALSRGMKRTGRIACLGAPVLTSARRWQRHGVARTVLLMWALRLAFYAGVPPARLARLYRDAR